MKASLSLLKKALKAAAKARNVEFIDDSNEGQLLIHTETIPAISDVRSICDAIYGNHDMVEPGYGYITVWIGEPILEVEMDFLREQTLRMALPHGTKL